MDEEDFLLDVVFYSEKTGDSVGGGVFVPSRNPSVDEIDVDDIMSCLEESFWECLCEFEDSARQAFDNGEIEDTDYDELFKVFGHFCISCTLNDEPININLDINPDGFIYPLLVDYLEISEE